MKKQQLIIFVLLLSLFVSCSNAEKKKEKIVTKKVIKVEVQNEPISLDFVKTFEGLINNEHEFLMKIISDDGKITGRYFYKNKRLEFEIEGTLNKNGEIVFNEYDNQENHVGIFKGLMPNKQTIVGKWSELNGKNETSFTLTESKTNYSKELEKKTKNKPNLKSLRIGDHNFTIQWVGWDLPGSVEITKMSNGSYAIFGKQESQKNNDYVHIEGVLDIISEKELEFTGKISSVVSYINNGKVCVRNGKQLFKSTKNRKYWRLQNMINCDGQVTDYIDIYF